MQYAIMKTQNGYDSIIAGPYKDGQTAVNALIELRKQASPGRSHPSGTGANRSKYTPVMIMELTCPDTGIIQ